MIRHYFGPPSRASFQTRFLAFRSRSVYDSAGTSESGFSAGDSASWGLAAAGGSTLGIAAFGADACSPAVGPESLPRTESFNDRPPQEGEATIVTQKGLS